MVTQHSETQNVRHWAKMTSKREPHMEVTHVTISHKVDRQVYTHTHTHSHYWACTNRVQCLTSHFSPVHCTSPILYHGGCNGNSRLNVAALREITVGEGQCFWLFVLNFTSVWQILWLAFCECCLLASSNQSHEAGSVISSLLEMRKLRC